MNQTSDFKNWAAKCNVKLVKKFMRAQCEQQDCWLALISMMNRHTLDILGWRLTRSGKAEAAETMLDEALIGHFGTLERQRQPLTLRSVNSLASL